MSRFKIISIIFLAIFAFALIYWFLHEKTKKQDNYSYTSAEVETGAEERACKDKSLAELRLESAEKLKRFGEIVTAYADDNNGKFYTYGSQLGPYWTKKDEGLPTFLEMAVKYVGAGKIREVSPEGMVVAYDLSLPSEAGGTNVLFADGHVEFIKANQLVKLGIKFSPRQNVRLSDGGKAYEVTFAEDWKPYVSAGALKIIGTPFYGVRDNFFAAVPHVRIQWSLKNLTSKPIVVQVQYKSIQTKGRGGTPGHTVAYELAPKQERLIDEFISMASAKIPVIFYIMAGGLLDSEYNLFLSSGHQIVTTEPVEISVLPANNLVVKDEENGNLRVKEVRLEYSQKEGNVLEVEIANQAKKPLPLVLYAAAGFPQKRVAGRENDALFNQITTTVKSNSTSIIRLPYSVPQTEEDPFLVFTVFESAEEWFTVDDELGDKRGLPYTPMALVLKPGYLNPICWGWFNLSEAAEKRQVKLLPFVPVEERAKLTAQRQSEHFLFRYGPGSYAGKHIDTAIKEREESYKKLSTLLKMELPDIVTVDLYPDMEAKGLGSGTTWTPANTVTNKHIAEVYNDSYQCDRYHELSHLFAYQFGHVPVSGGEPFVEPFAAYFEDHNINHDDTRKRLRNKLNEDKLKSLSEILLLVHGCEENYVLIDFLLKKDLEKFKNLYNHVISAKDSSDLEKACREIYGTDLKKLEQEWHLYLKKGGRGSE